MIYPTFGSKSDETVMFTVEKVLPVEEIIPQTNIIVFAPHFDDFLFMLGGYVLELKKSNILNTKNFHINILFSRSNYLARTGKGNSDTSLDRLKLATGKRLLEDMDCLDELLGEFNYTYQLSGEKECFVRSKPFADSEMEFPHGTYADFDSLDWKIFERTKSHIRKWAGQEDTAIILPIAFKEHIDHFITREAGLATARELSGASRAAFYFQEDKPYAGIASNLELSCIKDFISENRLKCRPYRHEPEKVIELAFKHYTSQVEAVYKTGIMQRSDKLKSLYRSDYPCDQIFLLP